MRVPDRPSVRRVRARTALSLGVTLGVLAAAPARAGDLHVDGANPNCPGSGTAADPFCEVGAAIQVAAPGDRVIVAPGVYVENLDFHGKAIVVESAAGPAVTVLDGGGLASCVTFASGEGADSVLRGFTLRNGAGVLLGVSPGGSEIRTGMAVYCEDSGPTVDGNVIEGTAVSAEVRGGGIASYGGAPQIVGNEIRTGGAELGGGVYCLGGSPYLSGNDVSGHDAAQGAGIYLMSCTGPKLIGNRVHHNGTVFFGYQSGPGAGVYAEACHDVEIRDHRSEGNRGSSGGGLNLLDCAGVVVEDSVFLDDATEFEGGAISTRTSDDVTIRRSRFSACAGSSGGAIFALHGGVVVEDSRVEGCFAKDSFWQVAVFTGFHVMRRCEVVNNGSDLVSGGGVGLTYGAVAEDCLIAGNSIGALLFDGELRRCTVTGSRYDGVWVLCCSKIESSIVSGNGLVSGQEIFEDGGGSVAVSWSLVEGGFPGVGNIGSNPGFVDAANGDFRLLPGSPCVDTGAPADTTCGVDVAGRPRRVSGHLTYVARVDRGAHEFSQVDLKVTRTGPFAYTLDSAGTPGLPSLLFVGVAPGVACLQPAGTMLIDLAQPFAMAVWPSPPSSVPVVVPPSAAGDPFVVQQMVLGLLPGTANLSGAVELTIE